jgi:quinol monooxygenase YgiN
MIVISGSIPVDVSKRDEIVAACNEMRTATMQEDGCVLYDFAFAIHDPGVVIIVEEWRDQACLDAHFVSPHMGEFGKKLGTLTTGRGDFSRYEVSEKRPLF